MWIATLPALLAVIAATVSFSRVSKTINPNADGPIDPSHPSCVETYGITLNSSEYYVREFAPAFGPKKSDNTPELSTVLRGMARNNCGESLKNVRIRIVVRDESGQKGEGYHLIEEMADGEVKPFERAWMGRVTSYEIAAYR